MKWPTLSPQKKWYAFCGLLLVLLVILAVDHIGLHQETARLKRANAFAAATGAETPDVSREIKQNIHSLDSEIDALEHRLNDLESGTRSFHDLERRVNYLETLVSRLDNRVEDAADSPAATISLLEGEVQSLRRKLDQHGKYIRQIMDKVGMWLPADLLGR
ncbi:MAG: hypothetical protein JSW66_13775 [Phycisphaerales bacterium]|nr:MAG: hypothetical protein JSW66_13775 [Phycisphaerales bacterium]